MIPKVINQIWIGPKKISDEHAGFIQQWKDMYPDFQHILWNDSMVEAEGLITEDKRRFFQPHDPPWPVALKADLIRYELIRRNGGIYVDVDTEPLKRMGDEVLDHDFFSAIQFNGQVAIGIFGGIANCKLLEDVCNEVVGHIEAFIERETIWNLEGAIDRATGPEFFTKICLRYCNTPRYKFFDPMYFYPYWIPSQRPRDCRSEFPNAYSVHHWAKNWV